MALHNRTLFKCNMAQSKEISEDRWRRVLEAYFIGNGYEVSPARNLENCKCFQSFLQLHIFLPKISLLAFTSLCCIFLCPYYTLIISCLLSWCVQHGAKFGHGFVTIKFLILIYRFLILSNAMTMQS